LPDLEKMILPNERSIGQAVDHYKQKKFMEYDKTAEF